AAIAGAAAALVLWRRNRELAHAAAVAEQHARDQRSRTSQLAAMLEALPAATLVHDDRGDLVLTNRAARDLFFQGRDVLSRDFLRMLADAPPALRESVTSSTDGIKRLAAQDGGESLLLWRRTLAPDGEGTRSLEMMVAAPLGDDVARVESDAWRRVLRTVA